MIARILGRYARGHSVGPSVHRGPDYKGAVFAN